MTFPLQWVVGDVTKAEHSFGKINQSAAEINPTDLFLIAQRRKANAIAARAIIRWGKGHKYWKNFGSEIQSENEKLADAINRVFFEPTYINPIKTLDLPFGGKAAASRSLSMVLDFVNIVNEIKIGDQLPEDDITGETTIRFLKKSKKVIEQLIAIIQAHLVCIL